MSRGRIENIAIKGISCALPTMRVDARSRYNDFGKEAVDKIIAKTGVETIYKTPEWQTASDLAYVAAKNLLDQKNISIDSINALVLVTQAPDYKLPATSCVLQHRLGLHHECICFDINLGCSGYVNGLFSISSIMANSNIEKALLLVAETSTKRISPLDRSLSLIFGDCGTATLLEKTLHAAPMTFKFKTFGDRFKKIIVPAGGNRKLNASTERVTGVDGNVRSDYDQYMDGEDVFLFSIKEVPRYIKEFMNDNCTSVADYDYLVLHQANRYILQYIGKKLRANISKIPIPMVKYGNTSSTSIPLALSYLRSQGVRGKKRILMSGFGVGLSWGSADVIVSFDDVLQIVHTDDYYEDGAVSHD